MTGFRFAREDDGARVVWEGNPDHQSAHNTILGWLITTVTSGFVSGAGTITNSMKGNLGEFIAYKIGESYVFTNGEKAITANAHAPLSDISRPDLDIVWMSFGTTPASDWAAIQEVKTTSQASLNLADDLISDYDKLFGENLKLTLRTRLDSLKNRLEQMQEGSLASRITSLGGASAERTRGIRVFPTLVHDAAYDSSDKMTIIRHALIGKGWPPEVVQCWSVKLGEIDDRLNRIARGFL
jgi:hypothetical protein